MSKFPLHEPLIDAVINFANTKLTDVSAVTAVFAKTWKPDSLPTLATCRKIQREVRDWLDKGRLSLGPIDAMMGAQREITGDPGITLTGRLGYHGETVFNDDGKPVGVRSNVTWRWWIAGASLRALCGLAVMSIEQAQSEGKLGRAALCARDGCGRYFIDRSSRGTPRAHCQTAECEKARNRERVKKSRGKTS